MRIDKVWRKLFECYMIGDRVRVRQDANWVYKGWEGIIETIGKSDYTGEPMFLVRCDRSVKEVGCASSHHRDEHLIGFFYYRHLELI